MNVRSRKLLATSLPMFAAIGSTLALNLHHAAAPVSAHIADATANLAVGGMMAGACAISVGAIGGVIALGVGGATLGFGAAFAIAATIEISAVACAS